MVFEINYPRTIKERRPEGHEPRAPRYRLTWDNPVDGIACAYFGIQARELSQSVEDEFVNAITEFLQQSSAAQTIENLRSIDTAGFHNTIVIAYWKNTFHFARWLAESGFRDWFNTQSEIADGNGYWFEPIVCHFDRHETIFSENHYKVGLACLPDTKIRSMTMNGYFGAARDRLPVSAIDQLDSAQAEVPQSNNEEETLGKHILASLPHNLTILRSGQFWEGAGAEQARDYEGNMQPKLHRGMEYLQHSAQQSGCLSLRMMVNVDEQGQEKSETSTVAAFHSLSHLEKWAASHKTHLAIYDHAIKMNRRYGKDREVVTWHELFVLQHGTTFEYINCHPATGMLMYAQLLTVGR